MPRFELTTDLQPQGDQPQAIPQLITGIRQGMRYQTLLGVTGSGKTFTIAHVIQNVQMPTLVLSPNKTLTAQLYTEFRELFPKNAVGYFVSYYDYYQPEAYLPQTDTYIEKEKSINEEVDKLRHAATAAVMSRRDVIIVATVSAIFSLGQPSHYRNLGLYIRKGEEWERDEILEKLTTIMYERNDYDFIPGRFRVRGDVVEIFPIYESKAFRIELYGNEIDRITKINPLTGEVSQEQDGLMVFPASHFVSPKDTINPALISIEQELEERLEKLKAQGKLLEAQRLDQRTRFDLEMIREVGYCHGMENYSRHFSSRKAGEPPWTLLDYFPEDFLLIIDESHITIPQIRGMYRGDRSRKESLVNYGFRLPSALDNRPLTFKEFEQRINQVIFVSATPGPYERKHSEQMVEQIIRPTGLVDPELIVKPTEGQIDNLIAEIRKRVERRERTLVTTLTKRMAEDLADYLNEVDLRVRYLHSEIDTLERVEILRDLRLGKFDVLVGINLLREGLDLPEVALIAILDADKEGYLRSETSLIQIIGRASRNVNGQVIMYADTLTTSMRQAIEETNRRRTLQLDFNERYGIVPQTIQKAVSSLIGAGERTAVETIEADYLEDLKKGADIETVLVRLETEMLEAANKLEFEKAAILRDQIKDLQTNVILRVRDHT
ncbi:MAG: excinuclease ABC subunit UvrB [Candidatus Heimdallarchaeota archaeon]